MTYQEARKMVEAITYIPICAEGTPIHPGRWTVAEGIDYPSWYERHINAYIKHHYGVTNVHLP